MADNEIKKLRTRIAQKYDIVANWSVSTLRLLKGELAFDETNRFKVGDGTKTWSELEYCGSAQTKVYTSELPSGSALDDIEPGTLALDSSGTLNYLVERTKTTQEGQEPLTEKVWVPVATNTDIITVETEIKSDIADIQSNIAELETNNDNLLIAIQSNTNNIKAINDKIGDTTNSEYNKISGETISSKLVTANSTASEAKTLAEKLDGELFDNQSLGRTIKPSVLPSFVDDVIEGFVVNDDQNYKTIYDLTHSEETNQETGEKVVKITGFFAAISESNTLTLRTEELTTKYGLITLANVSIEDAKIVHNGKEYTLWNGTQTKLFAPVTDAIYVDIFTNSTYRWGGTQFVLVASDLAIGTTAGTAFEGDRGIRLENTVFGDGTTENPGLVEKVEDIESQLENNPNNYVTNPELESRLNELDASLSAIISSGDTAIASSIKELSDKVGNISSDGITLESGIEETVANELSYLNTNLITVQSLSNSNKNNIDTLTTKTETLERNIATLEEKTNSNFAALAATIEANAEKEIDDKKDTDAQISALAASLSQSIEEITSDTTISNKVEELETAVEDLTPRVETLETKTTALETSTAILQDNVTDLEAGLEAAALMLEEKKADKTDLDSKIDYSDVLILDCGNSV